MTKHMKTMATTVAFCRSKSVTEMSEAHALETSMLSSVTPKSVGSCAHGSAAMG